VTERVQGRLVEALRLRATSKWSAQAAAEYTRNGSMSTHARTHNTRTAHQARLLPPIHRRSPAPTLVAN